MHPIIHRPLFPNAFFSPRALVCTHFPSAWPLPIIILCSPSLLRELGTVGSEYRRTSSDGETEWETARGWAHSFRPSLPRQNKPWEWKSSYRGDSRQIKGDCQEMILLVFKPCVPCHNKTEGMLAEAPRTRGRGRGEGEGRERAVDLFSPLASCHCGASPLKWLYLKSAL